MSECKLNFSNNILFVSNFNSWDEESLYIIENFCGLIVRDKQHVLLNYLHDENRKKNIVYWLGEQIECDLTDVRVLVVREYCKNYQENRWKNSCLISLGEIPINFHGAGVLFRRFFSKNYFKDIQAQHQFQSLTESNKPGSAYRKGIYLTDVIERQDKSELEFHLLRCSSNLQGPTDQLSTFDREIIASLNQISVDFFDEPAPLNHVLAQIYYNKRDETTNKEAKAKISRHSDKTKDMPQNGLIAFTSFYDFDNLVKHSDENRFFLAHSCEKDRFDLCYDHKTSILTQLEFVLKDPQTYPALKKVFRVTLYPNSVFMISLETNRLYTHEIKPPTLPVEKIPTRMGYVIRCSKTRAIYRDGKTFIMDDGEEKQLHDMNAQDMTTIKTFYQKENLSSEIIEYPFVCSSLNQGDYLKPNYTPGSSSR